MPEVGIRELKAQASEIVRSVREHRTSYTITYRGRPVAVLSPLDIAGQEGAALDGDESTDVWDALTSLGEEIARGWESPLSSTELLSQMRR